jgi:hypothetical protein
MASMIETFRKIKVLLRLSLPKKIHVDVVSRLPKPAHNHSLIGRDIGLPSYTKMRLKVTLRHPKWSAPKSRIPYVHVVDEGGSGETIAIFGPDCPIARADAAHMVALWNSALNG